MGHYEPCTECGKGVCTFELDECRCDLNQDGSELDSGGWVCSGECWGRASAQGEK